MLCCTNVVNHYSPQVLAILLSMVITGAARSVVVKLFYQFGFEKPIFVTLLYLSLVVHFVSLQLVISRFNTCTCHIYSKPHIKTP
jgi:hypothetical protein